MRTIHRTIVSALIFSKDGKLLMGMKDPSSGGVYTDCWHIPGGGIDEGETQEAALRSELLEEVGIDTIDCKVALADDQGNGETEKTLKDTGEKVLCKMQFNVYRVDVDKDAAAIETKASDDLVQLEWVDLNHLDNYKLTPPSVTLFERLGLGIGKTQLAVNTYDKIAGIYTQQYFDDLTDAPWIDKLLAYLPAEAKILDVGCGPGEFAKYLLGKGYDVSGVDLSGEMIKIARERVDSERFSVMDMRKLVFDDATFDGVLAAYSLIHIQTVEVASTLQEFHRVLKPNGYLMTITQQGEPDHIVDEPLMPGENMFINFFTRNNLAAYFQKAVFEVIYQEELPSQDPESLSDHVIYTIGRKTV